MSGKAEKNIPFQMEYPVDWMQIASFETIIIQQVWAKFFRQGIFVTIYFDKESSGILILTGFWTFTLTISKF